MSKQLHVPAALFPGKEPPSIHWTMDWVVQWWSGRFEVEKNLLFLLGIEQRFRRRPAINLCRLSHLDSLRKVSGSEN